MGEQIRLIGLNPAASNDHDDPPQDNDCGPNFPFKNRALALFLLDRLPIYYDFKSLRRVGAKLKIAFEANLE